MLHDTALMSAAVQFITLSSSLSHVHTHADTQPSSLPFMALTGKTNKIGVLFYVSMNFHVMCTLHAKYIIYMYMNFLVNFGKHL